jgi:hypothetical protein
MSHPLLLPFEEWLASLPTSTRAKAKRLLEQMRALGAPEPEEWVRSEIFENIPQLTRFLVLRRLWQGIDEWRDKGSLYVHSYSGMAEREPSASFADAGMAMKRMLDAGIAPEDIGRVARLVAYETTFAVLNIIDEGYDPDGDEQLPHWILVEETANGKRTGRVVGGLHESLLSLDPSGREGRPE